MVCPVLMKETELGGGCEKDPPSQKLSPSGSMAPLGRDPQLHNLPPLCASVNQIHRHVQQYTCSTAVQL